MRIMLEPFAYLPTRAHKTDAGLDIRAMIDQLVPARSAALFRTGVHIELPKGYCGILVSKSGLNINYDLTSTGLIDEGYTGEIFVKLYNHGRRDYMVHAGDKISQLIIVPVLYEGITVVEDLGDTERGTNGFGSTGR